MSVYLAVKNLADRLEPLIAKLGIEPVGGVSQENMNFLVANAIANEVMQIAHYMVQEAREDMKAKMIKAMETD